MLNTLSFRGEKLNLVSFRQSSREPNALVCDDRTNLETDSERVTSCFRMESLFNSFAIPKYSSAGAKKFV